MPHLRYYNKSTTTNKALRQLRLNECLEEQDYTCAICLTSYATDNTDWYKLNFCRYDGNLRGVLCKNCNISFFYSIKLSSEFFITRDNIRFELAQNYISKYCTHNLNRMHTRADHAVYLLKYRYDMFDSTGQEILPNDRTQPKPKIPAKLELTVNDWLRARETIKQRRKVERSLDSDRLIYELREMYGDNPVELARLAKYHAKQTERAMQSFDKRTQRLAQR